MLHLKQAIKLRLKSHIKPRPTALKNKIYYVLIATLICISPCTNALDEVEISDLRWVDEGHLTRQRADIEDITKMEFGSRLRGNKSDLRYIERIIKGGFINQTEIERQQALGIVLGDILVTELKMEWKVYKDNDGESRAICLPKTTHCLFPVTMLSKRMRRGVTPDVNQLYNRAVELMEHYLPRLPYSVK